MSLTGKIVTVYGNMVTAEVEGSVCQNAVAYCQRSDGVRLMSEIIRIRGKLVDMQVFELTRGLKVGDPVEITDDLLSVKLGPGLIGMVYDGLQNPLVEMAQKVGNFLKPGNYLKALDRSKKWSFTPTAKVGDVLTSAENLGSVKENIFATEKELAKYPAGTKLLTEEERIKKEKDINMRSAFLMLIYGFAPKTKIFKMRWEDLDFNHDLWLDMPLSGRAVLLLQDLPQDCEWVFMGRGKFHLTDPRFAWKKIVEKA